MNKIWLIIQREYLSRVKKKSFIIMTILGPILMATVIIAPVMIAKWSDETKTVGIVDESGFFTDAFKDTDKLKFKTLHLDINDAKAQRTKLGCDIILYIPKPAYIYPQTIFLYSEKNVGLSNKAYIRNAINDDLRELRLKNAGVPKDVIETAKSSIAVRSITLSEGGQEKERIGELEFILGMILGLMIYFFIFLFGTQVMRGVIEEKTNRIVEVIISSVKPFQLMMGKIIGIALVGITQFALWVILTGAIVFTTQGIFKDELQQVQTHQLVKTGQQIDPTTSVALDHSYDKTAEVLKALMSINYTALIFSFLFYFLFGYLIYAALFASIGSAVDNDADTQQFVLPVTVPLIISIASLQFIANNPDGPAAFWLSVIPFTSPVAMMVRIPFGVPWWEVGLSMGLLVIGFLATTWFAAKIYRTGILMYGKKPTYKELWKWLRYKN
jgi:ABC-2 type transport system permease protein